MDATIMQSILSLLPKLKDDFPGINFVENSGFSWDPTDSTVSYAPQESVALLLHELAHSELNHNTYDRDVTLLKIEQEAWNHAVRQIAPRYNLKIKPEEQEKALDTYRDWLHRRSICPDCGANGIQTSRYIYKCLACSTTWRVNEARICSLRRTKQ